MKTSTCVSSNPWYQCVPTILIFSFFVLLLLYTLFMTGAAWNKITQFTQDVTTNDARHELKRLHVLYLLNLIASIVSLIIVLFFVVRAFPNLAFWEIFNEYFAAGIVIFLVVITSWNIHIYRTLEDGERHSGIQAVNGLILGISCIMIITAISYYYVITQKQKSKSNSGSESPSPFLLWKQGV